MSPLNRLCVFAFYLLACSAGITGLYAQRISPAAINNLYEKGLIEHRKHTYESYILALEHYQKAFSQAQRANYKPGVARGYKLIGGIYDAAGSNIDTAVVYYERALRLYEQLHDTLEAAEMYAWVGVIYFKKGRWDDGRVMLKKSIQLFGEYGDYIQQARYCIKLAECPHLKDDENLRMAQALIEKHNLTDSTLLEEFYWAKYQIFSMAKDSVSAIRMLEKILRVVPIAHIGKRIEIHTQLANIMAEMGAYKQAYEHRNEAAKLIKDESYEKLHSKMREIRASHALDAKQAELRLKEEQLAREQSNLLLAIVAVCCALLLALVFFLYSRKMKRAAAEMSRQKRELAQSEREKSLLLRELHHRVKNNLQTLISMFNLQARRLRDPAALDAIASGKSRVEAISLVHAGLYGEHNNVDVPMAEYIDQLVTSVSHTFGHHEVKFSSNIEAISLDADLATLIGLIVNELLVNSCKHCKLPDGTILAFEIGLKLEDTTLHLHYADNGQGLPSGFDLERTETFGVKLIRTLTLQMNGSLKQEKATWNFTLQPDFLRNKTIPANA